MVNNFNGNTNNADGNNDKFNNFFKIGYMNYSFGANASPYDIRTFSYIPTKANVIGGFKWSPDDIEDQKRVGICTAIHLTMHARKYFKIDFSEEFQYLCQKKLYDLNWDEGSSIFHALKVGKNIGFLPASDWTFTTLADRDLPYQEYIQKLQIPDSEFNRLLTIAQKYKLKAYASVPINRDALANAIDAQGALPARFLIGSEWWTAPIEPLQPPKSPISGHAINLTNYNGNSFRIANSWGKNWNNDGTAYFILPDYKPTEAWSLWFESIPQEIEIQIESRESIKGKILNLIQQIIVLIMRL